MCVLLQRWRMQTKNRTERTHWMVREVKVHWTWASIHEHVSSSVMSVSSWPFHLLKTFSAAASVANIQCGFRALKSVSLWRMLLCLFIGLFLYFLIVAMQGPFLHHWLLLGRGHHSLIHPLLRDSDLLKELCSPCPLPLLLLLHSVCEFCSCCSSLFYRQHQIQSSGSGSEHIHNCLLSSVNTPWYECIYTISLQLMIFCYEVSFESRHCPGRRFFVQKMAGFCCHCVYFCSRLPTHKVKRLLSLLILDPVQNHFCGHSAYLSAFFWRDVILYITLSKLSKILYISRCLTLCESCYHPS